MLMVLMILIQVRPETRKMRKKGMGGKRLAVGIGRQAHDEEVVHSSSSFAHLEKKLHSYFFAFSTYQMRTRHKRKDKNYFEPMSIC